MYDVSPLVDTHRTGSECFSYEVRRLYRNRQRFGANVETRSLHVLVLKEEVPTINHAGTTGDGMVDGAGK